jgi:DNA polymerase III subunit delta'
VDQLAKGLQEKLSIHLTQALSLARISSGRPGLALRLQADPALNTNRRQWMDELLVLLGENLSGRFEYVERQVKLKNSNKEERDLLRMRLREGFIFWQSLWRDVMLQATGLGAELANVDYRQQVEKLAVSVKETQAGELISQLETASSRLGSANIQLLVEALVMGFPTIKTNL